MNLGLGDADARFNVYMDKQPDYPPLAGLSAVRALADNDITAIGQHCGNGWRKVFNVYAKLIFALGAYPSSQAQGFTCWQQYRDEGLLQRGSATALLFSPPQTNEPAQADFRDESKIHLLMGRTYGKSLNLGHQLSWLNNDFAIDRQQRLIICPYFDYRQLSNAKILYLVELIKTA